MNETASIFILIAVFILLMLGLPQLLTRRAVSSVIQIFRQHNALSIESAKTTDELGLKTKTITQSLLGPALRDYKPTALQMLISAHIIQATEDGKLYLSEKNLASSRWQK
jgi:hypothetical protein